MKDTNKIAHKEVKTNIGKKYFCSSCKKFIGERTESGMGLADKCTGITTVFMVGIKADCRCGDKYFFKY